MITMRIANLRAIFVMAVLLFGAVQASAVDQQRQKYEKLLNEVVAGPIAVVVSQKLLLSAVKIQNLQNANLTQDEIGALDARWRAEFGSDDRPLIEDLISRPLSIYLKAVQDNSDGILTEIFVVDARGLNVGQSAVTSDYWQGDEEKWQVPFLEGRVMIGDIKLDESTGKVQCQVSVPVLDAKGRAIGTATFAVRFDQKDVNSSSDE